MSAAWVLEKARSLQNNVATGEVLSVSVDLTRRRARHREPVKHLFKDRHLQKNARYEVPTLLEGRSCQHYGSSIGKPHSSTQHNLPAHRVSRALEPRHAALAARLAAAAERQQRRQAQQQQQQQEEEQVLRSTQHKQRMPLRHGRWSLKVHADIHAVCQELQLSASIADALSRAAANGRVSCNPGILLPQLARLLPLQPQLSSLTGCQDSLAVLLAVQPALLHADPRTLQANCTHLQERLGQQAAAAAVQRCPQLLGCSPYRLAANLATLQSLLGYSSTSAAAAVAVRQPMLLLCSADNLQLRWQQLQQQMAAVPLDQLSKQVRRTPELLLMRPSVLAAKLKCLELLFAAPGTCQASAAVRAAGRTHAGSASSVTSTKQGSTDQVVKLQHEQQQQQQQQHVLGVYKQFELGYRLHRLELLAAQQQQQQQACATSHNHNYGYGTAVGRSSAGSTHTNSLPVLQPQQRRHVQQQQQHCITPPAAAAGAPAHAAATAVPSMQPPAAPAAIPAADVAGGSGAATDPRVQHLALKVPGLLSLNPATLHSHVTELQLLLNLQADDPQLARLVLLQPGLLTQAPRTLANKLQLLQHLTGRSEVYVHEMVLRCPAVLTLSMDSVQRKWLLLQQCTVACSMWQQQLAAAPAVSVGMMLCYGIARLQRLQYLVQLAARLQHTAPSTITSSSSSTSTSSGVVSGRRRRRQQPGGLLVSHGGNSGDSSSSSSSRSSSSVAAHTGQGAVAHAAGASNAARCGLRLDQVPWRSVVQQADAVFCARYPGFLAWQQQQQQQQHCSAAKAAPQR